MKFEVIKKWLLGRPARWAHLGRVPWRQLWVLLVAVFLLFSVVGFYMDVMEGGRLPYVLVLMFAVLAGLNSVMWVVVLARLRFYWLLLLIVGEQFFGYLNQVLAEWVTRAFHPPLPDAQTGLHFAGTSILVVVIVSYILLSRYMGITGKEAYRLKNELELAHSIQKTLVPAIASRMRCFEMYGISEPSEKVGGDLVDVVELGNGDAVAYLADIAGHGLQAGILMGMLKTSARTALTGQSEAEERLNDGGAMLSMLMERLNLVLPQVKEAHMYATFTALRLNADGEAFYGMAASPPLLHWSAARGMMERIEEQQFPLGLLPVPEFPASRIRMDMGDIMVIATDGILEVTGARQRARDEVEFGTGALEALIAENATLPLPELAAVMLRTVRGYGRQVDDQTLLLVRRVAV